MSTTITIGTGRVVTPFRYLDRRFECAAWSRTTDVEPQEFEVRASWSGYGRLSFYVILKATIVDEDFQSYFAGNACGRRRDTKENAGKPFELHLGLGDDYNFAKVLLDGSAFLACLSRAPVLIDPDLYLDPVTVEGHESTCGNKGFHYVTKLGAKTEEAIHSKLRLACSADRLEKAAKR